MRILLYNPDNGVTRNFMPHLWMFLLQALTPPGHEVVLIDGNAQPMDEESIARYVREQNISAQNSRVRRFNPSERWRWVVGQSDFHRHHSSLNLRPCFGGSNVDCH
jgi:hypothetical protein